MSCSCPPLTLTEPSGTWNSPGQRAAGYSEGACRSQLLLDSSGSGGSRDSASSREWFEGRAESLLGSSMKSRSYCGHLTSRGQISTGRHVIAAAGGLRAALCSCWCRLWSRWSFWSLWSSSPLLSSVVSTASRCPLQFWHWSKARSKLEEVILSSVSTGMLGWEHNPESKSQKYRFELHLGQLFIIYASLLFSLTF